MGTDAYPWKVVVTYPWRLIELIRESPTDRIPYIIAIDKAAEHKGGQRVGNSHNPHYEHRRDRNSESYAFPDPYKTALFVADVSQMFEKCESGQLRKVVEEYKTEIVDRPYTISVRMEVEGKIGGGL